MEVHDQVSQIFQRAFRVKKNKTEAAADDVAEATTPGVLQDPEGGGLDSTVPEDADLRLQEPSKDISQEERQSTYYGNANLWLTCKVPGPPATRLWCLHSVISVQQGQQHQFMKQVGVKWERAEWVRRTQPGATPRYRVVAAAEGELTDVAVDQYSSLMTSPSLWTDLPQEHRTHHSAQQCFRSLSAALCSKEQLDNVIFGRCPVKGFLLLSNKRIGIKEETATWLLKMWNSTPCVLDMWWRKHISKYPTLQSLLSVSSLDEIAFLGEAAEVENVTAETNNAMIRRQTRKNRQCRFNHICDISSSWVSSQEQANHESIWGEQLSGSESEHEGNNPGEQPGAGGRGSGCPRRHGHAGGGGLARAFVSSKAKICKTPEGRADFKEIMRLWHIEKSKDHSPELESLKEDARLATLARRDQHMAGQRHVSSFGEILPNRMRALQRHAAVQTVLEQVQGATQPASGLAQPTETRMVPFDMHAAQSQPLAALASMQKTSTALASYGGPIGTSTEEQHKMLRAVVRAAGAEAKAQRAKEDKHFQETIKGDAEVCGINKRQMGLTGADVRAVTCGRTTFCHVHDHVINQCTKKVKELKDSHSKLLEHIFGLWNREHELIKEQQNPDVGNIPNDYRMSPCCLAGQCVCSGQGLVTSVGVKRLSDAICSFGIKKKQGQIPKFREWLLSGMIVFRLDGGDDGSEERWHHIGLMYLRPKRPTTLPLSRSEHTAWGRVCVRPLKWDKGVVKAKTALCELSELDLHL